MQVGLKAARRYARALYEYAVESGVLEAVRSDMRQLNATAKASPALSRFYGNYLVPASTRQNILKDCFEKRLHPVTFRFVRLIEARKRLPLLPGICHAFHEYDDRVRGIVHGSVSLPFTGEETSMRLVKDHLFKKMPGIDFHLKETVDPSLMGGFRIRLEDRILDFSIAGQLHALRQRFG